MKKLFWIFVALATITSCGGNKSESNTEFVIKTDTAKLVDQSSVKKFAFIAQPYHTTDLSFRVGGTIDRFDAFAGNHFRQGEIIASIDDRDFVIAKERAEGVYNQAKAEYERIKILYDKNNVSASTFDKAKADYISAKASYQTAVNDLSDTKLIAPFDGYIGQTFVEQHQDVRSSQPIVTFVDISKMRIETYVSQETALNADKVKNITLYFDAIPNTSFQARIEDVSKNTTRNNFSYLLTALLDNNEAKILSGMSGEVVFDTGVSTQIVVVPQTALSHRPTLGDYVWCVDSSNQTVSQRIVQQGQLLPNGYVEIKSNLQAGEVVAVSGLRFLYDGLNVKLQ